MKSKKNLVFLGMMGCGKSSIGKLVSKKLNIKFMDIDNLIEEHAKMSISNIFDQKGENYFRNLEEKITLKHLRTSGNTISLGGGAFLNKKIRDEILKNHISFWLKWKSETIIKRIGSSHKRPIAFKASKTDLMDLIKKRSNFYSKAMYRVKCDNLSKNQIVQKIIDIYEKI